MSRALHRWHDKSSPKTFCTVCGCDRTVTHPDDVACLAAGEPMIWGKPSYTRAGKDYQTRGHSPKGSPRGQGYCDRTWPAGWIPANAPGSFITPPESFVRSHGAAKRKFYDEQARLHMLVPNDRGL